MLEFFRQHVGGFFGLIVIGLLAVAFALSFGSQSAGWGKGQSEHFAASVHGTKIKDSTLKYAFNLSGGRNMDFDESQRIAKQREVLNGIIERQLLLDAADDFGIFASTEEAEDKIVRNDIYLSQSVEALAQKISSNMFLDPAMSSRILVNDGHRVPQSFNDAEGKFDIEGYQKFVRYYLQTTEENFVEQQRLEIIAARMRQLLVSPVRVSDEEVRSAYEREHNTATIEYIRLIPSHFSDTLKPTEDELKTWATDHPDEVKQYYETNKFRYTNLEKQARARHILIKTEEDASAEDKAPAREQIETLLTRARKGEDFATLAREHSQDTGSAVKGGDLGYTPRGRMVPEFDEAMFSAEPQTITDVVETKYGFHIIKVEGFREGNVSLEDATLEIAELLYRKAKGEEIAQEKADDFLRRLKVGEKMSSLVPNTKNGPSSHLSSKVMKSRPFSRTSTSIPGIGETPEMVNAAFELSRDNPIPKTHFKVRNDYYVMRLDERAEPSDEEFAKLRPKEEEKLLSIKQAAWLVDQIGQIRRTAEKDGELAIYYTPAKQQAAPKQPETSPRADTPAGPATKAKSPSPKDKPATNKESSTKEEAKEDATEK